MAEVHENLAAAAGSPMELWLVLDAPPEADCATVRAEMDELPLCRRGRCVGGKVWSCECALLEESKRPEPAPRPIIPVG